MSDEWTEEPDDSGLYEGVDDPEALRRAEEAVAHADERQGPERPIEGEWATVARQASSVGVPELESIAAALDADGLDVGWQPYPPTQAISYTWPGTQRAPYEVQVPVAQEARAREVLYGVAPAGVVYPWAPDADVRTGPGGRTTFAPIGVTGVRGDISDNERLERMTSGGLPTGALLAIAGGIMAIFAALFYFFR